MCKDNNQNNRLNYITRMYDIRGKNRVNEINNPILGKILLNTYEMEESGFRIAISDYEIKEVLK